MSESNDLPQASATTSEADADHSGGTQSPDDQRIAGISDDQLPADLQPGEDNPLAEPLDPDDESTKDPDELGMTDTQDDTSGTYESSGETPSTQSGTESGTDKATEDTDPESVSGDGAQGAGISG
jgi:hypothetical protein